MLCLFSWFSIALNSSTEKHETQLTKFLGNQQAIATETRNGGNAKIEPFMEIKGKILGLCWRNLLIFQNLITGQLKGKLMHYPCTTNLLQ